MSRADELVKLDVLRKSGVLTGKESDAEKAKLLGHRCNLKSILPESLHEAAANE
jgi:hypothetical protein